jgi:hypothetical protein
MTFSNNAFVDIFEHIFVDIFEHVFVDIFEHACAPRLSQPFACQACSTAGVIITTR